MLWLVNLALSYVATKLLIIESKRHDKRVDLKAIDLLEEHYILSQEARDKSVDFKAQLQLILKEEEIL